MSTPTKLQQLVELARAATDAIRVELVFDGAPEGLVAEGPMVGIGPIGHSETWTHQTQLCGDANETMEVSSWVRSFVSVPIAGPSAESGWIVAAHQHLAAFDSDTVVTLGRVARLIEENLDRTVEQLHLDELGAVLRSNQTDLQATRDRLEVSNRELEQFAYIAAHELVAPLHAVSIYAEVLTGLVPHDGSEQSQKCAEQIQVGVALMNKQVQYLLELSRTQLDTARAEPVDLAQVVDDAIDTIAEPLSEVDANVDVGELPIVLGRAVPLQSVFANLLTNAVRYRDPSQPLEITISSEEKSDGHRVLVRDNGLGVDISDRKRVFQLFERASNTPGGSGIGLALSRRIVEALGGTIGIEPGYPTGSVFWVELRSATSG